MLDVFHCTAAALALADRGLAVQISHNRSLDGVLDLLNSKNMTEAGPVDLIDDDADDTDDLLPPSGEGTQPRLLLPQCGHTTDAQSTALAAPAMQAAYKRTIHSTVAAPACK